MPITFDNPSDISALLNALKTDAAQTPQSPAPDPGAFKQTAGEKQAPLDVEEADPPKAEPTQEPKKAEPKPTPEPKSAPEPKAAPEPKSEPKSAPEPKPAPADPPKPAPTPKPTPSPKPSANSGPPARNWNGTRFGVQMGIPPSAVRNLKGGETVAGIKGLGKAQWGAGQHHAKSAGNLVSKFVPSAIGKGGVKLAARALPVVGSLYSAYASYQAFKTGDVIGGVLNLVGVIPGPIGWIGMGAAAIWEFGGWGDPYDKWAEPDGTNVYMLPAAAKDEAGVTDLDKAITDAQRSVFSFQDGPDGTVWDQNHPVALRLDGANVKTALDAWVTGITSLFAQIDQAMQQSGEEYFQKQRQTLQPHFKAMSDLKGKGDEVMTQLKAASIGAGEAYKAVLDANASTRDQLAEKGKITDQGPATAVKAQLEKALSQVTEAETKLGNILAETPSPVVNGTTNAPGTREPYKAPQEKPATPTPTTPATPLPSITPQQTTPKAETPKTDDTLNRLLSQLGQQAKAPTSAMPTSNLGGGNPLGNTGLGGGNPSSGTPLSQTKPETKDTEPKKLVDEKKPTERKKEDVKPLGAAKPEQEKAQVKPAQPEQKAAPATAPVAAPAAAGAPAPAAQGKAETKPEKPNTDVDVKGQKTTFPDPKTAALARTLAAADPTHPVSLADAAKAAGLTAPVPGQDPGQQVPPSDAKPGDIMVAGERKYMLLGDGKFYDLTDYKVVGADELPKDMGDRAGYFRLNDPNPGQPAGTPPVSPQSQAAPAMPVANPTGAQPGPVAGPGAAPAPGMPPTAPGGVPSVGAPGVPKPGTPGSGPGNASATDTGTGQGGPSVGGQRMDPTAVR